MDAQIERLIGQRDYRGALEALAGEHGRALGRYCAGLLGSTQDGEEALQEAMVQALRSMPRYRGEGIRAWAFGIARHVCAAELKRRTRRRSLWVRVFGGATFETTLPTEDADARLSVQGALGRISPKLREALLLRYQQGMDATEVADVLGISHAAARKRISLALKDLRTNLRVEPRALDGRSPHPVEDGLRGERP
jgi:RNA polymerase sigma-70 factor (ECF subfamily)